MIRCQGRKEGWHQSIRSLNEWQGWVPFNFLIVRYWNKWLCHCWHHQNTSSVTSGNSPLHHVPFIIVCLHQGSLVPVAGLLPVCVCVCVWACVCGWCDVSTHAFTCVCMVIAFFFLMTRSTIGTKRECFQFLSWKSQFNVNWIDEEGKNAINSDSDAVLKGGEHGEDKNQP